MSSYRTKLNRLSRVKNKAARDRARWVGLHRLAAMFEEHMAAMRAALQEPSKIVFHPDGRIDSYFMTSRSVH